MKTISNILGVKQINCAILTAENPNGKQHSKVFNLRSNYMLRKLLDDMRYTYTVINGCYNNNNETSILIYDITQAECESICKQFNQICYVYIVENETIGNIYELIYTDKSDYYKCDSITIDTDLNDNFSILNEIKFSINFFE